MTNDFGYNIRSEVVSADMGANDYRYAYDPIGNRLTATNNGTGWNYLSNTLNQYTNIADGVIVEPSYDLDGSAPSEARRFLRGESPRRVRTSHPLVPSVGTVEEESHPNDIV